MTQQILWYLGNYVEAIKNLNKALAIDPNNVNALTRVYLLIDWEDIMKLFDDLYSSFIKWYPKEVLFN